MLASFCGQLLAPVLGGEGEGELWGPPCPARPLPWALPPGSTKPEDQRLFAPGPPPPHPGLGALPCGPARCPVGLPAALRHFPACGRCDHCLPETGGDLSLRIRWMDSQNFNVLEQ